MATPKHRTADGSSYFVTTRCWQGRSIFQVSEIASILLNTLLYYRERGAYQLHEFVVMPNHIHLILTPSATTTLEKAVQFIKGGSSREIHLQRVQKMQTWQEGFHDWTIRGRSDWRSKVEYIRMNPVRAKLVADPREWLNCSASGRFALDPIPARYRSFSSGAKAPILPMLTQGLKPLPPEEQSLQQKQPPQQQEPLQKQEPLQRDQALQHEGYLQQAEPLQPPRPRQQP
jgi:REP-associated tyrosine transposase